MKKANRKMWKPMTYAALISASLVACSALESPTQHASDTTAVDAATEVAAVMDMDAAKEKAQQAAKTFSSALKTALKEKMEAEGTEGAIHFCHDEAPKIAARVSEEFGVRLGRVPVEGRQRSPANTAEAWQAEGLNSFQEQLAAGTPMSELVKVDTQHLPDGVGLRMMRGIPVEPACLACHGSALSAETKNALQRLYPNDQAVGFNEGDLRGALWVEVPTALPQ